MLDHDHPFAWLGFDPAEDLDEAAIAANEAREAAEAAAAAAAAKARKAARQAGTRAGFRAAGDRRFVGVVRHNGAALVECGHEHTNRDWTTRAGGLSAVDCAKRIIAGAANPATADRYATETRNRWTALTSAAGFVHTAATVAGARAAAAAAADAYLAAVSAVRAATEAEQPPADDLDRDAIYTVTPHRLPNGTGMMCGTFHARVTGTPRDGRVSVQEMKLEGGTWRPSMRTLVRVDALRPLAAQPELLPAAPTAPTARADAGERRATTPPARTTSEAPTLF